MQNIVISVCYGGFGVSRDAMLRLRELGCRAAMEEVDYGEPFPDDGSIREEALIGENFCREIDRDDPLLIQVINEMGEAVNSRFSKLKIVEIPDDVEWQIEEDDGLEWVSEKHRTWWGE